MAAKSKGKPMKSRVTATKGVKGKPAKAQTAKLKAQPPLTRPPNSVIQAGKARKKGVAQPQQMQT